MHLWQFEQFMIMRVRRSGALRASISISTLIGYLQRANEKDYLDKKDCQNTMMLCFEDWWILPLPCPPPRLQERERARESESESETESELYTFTHPLPPR